MKAFLAPAGYTWESIGAGWEGTALKTLSGNSSVIRFVGNLSGEIWW